MPSPIAHATIGYAIFEIAHRTGLGAHGEGSGKLRWQLAASIALSLLPDVDSLIGLLAGNLGRYHNNLTHSLLLVVVVASMAGVLASPRGRRVGTRWFVITLACYGSHLLADLVTVGRGIMLFWPWSTMRFRSPVPLFYGLHWSDGLWSVRHLWTVASELGSAAVAVVAVRFLSRWRQHRTAGSDQLPWPERGR